MYVSLLSKHLSYIIAYRIVNHVATVSRKRQAWVEFYNLPSKRLRVCTGLAAAH